MILPQKTHNERKSDVGIWFFAARVLVVGFLGPDLHEVPLNALVVRSQVHAIWNHVLFGASVFPMLHVHLISEESTERTFTP